MKIKDLLKTRDQWTKCAMARTKKGKACNSNSPKAVRWCLEGAANRCYRGVHKSAVLATIRDEIRTPWLNSWNDRTSRKFSTVKALLKKLNI